MNRVWTALLTAATVAVFAGIVYVLNNNPKVPDAGQTPGYTAAPAAASSHVPATASSSSTAPPTTTSSSASASGSAGTASTVIAFLGDDYTQGVGGSGGSSTFPALVASSLKVHDKVYYLDGAGYAKTDANGQAYGDLVSKVIAGHPDIVVVSGGRNDRADDPGTLSSKAAALFAALHAGLPTAMIVAVAPWWGDSTHPAVLDQVATAIQAGVTTVGGTYLDISDPLFNHPSWMSNDADPNDQGYAAIAASLEPKLQALLPV